MEDTKNKITFFKRLKIAIFNLEDFGMFLGERLSVAFKYFFMLILLITIITLSVETFDFSKRINKVYDYVQNELPDFEYKDGNVKFTNNVEAYDRDYKFRLFINTDEKVDDNIINGYKSKIYDNGYGVIALKDKVICISSDIEAELTYSQLLEEYDFGISNKNDLIENMNEIGKGEIIILYFIAGFILLFITNTIIILSDVCLVAVFGWIASRLCGIAFKIAPMIILAIYSLTLSIVLKTIYTCELTLAGYVVQYFDIIYLLIAYVYMIAALFMIKYDIMKETQEIQQIIEIHKKIHQQLDEDDDDDYDEEKKPEDKENKEDKKENDNKEEPEVKKNKEEPSGSEI